MMIQLRLRLLIISLLFLCQAYGSDGYRVLPRGTSLDFLKGTTSNGVFDFSKGRLPAVVFFFEPGCEMCKAVVPELTTLWKRTESEVRWFGFTQASDTGRINDFIREVNPPWTTVTVSPEIWEKCKIDATPTIYLTDRRNRIVSGRMVRAEDLQPLLPGTK